MMNLRGAASIEKLNAQIADTAAHSCGIHVDEIGDDWIQAWMPLDQRTRGLDGSLRLAALAILAETVGSIAAAISVDLDKFVCLGQTLEVVHLNAAIAGPVKAKATQMAVDERERQIWQIAIFDATPAPIAHAKLVVMIMPRNEMGS